MYSFKNDYAEGAHPRILQKLLTSNLQQENGYGDDSFTKQAKDYIRQAIACDDASIFFVSGGTQTNLLVIAHLLRPHEAVIAASTGHIYVHETGAIEATGHRIITVDSSDGKVTVEKIEEALQAYNMRPHMVAPRMVYISNSTEIGSIYKKEELQKLYNCCQKHNLYLFMDGARLGHALTANTNDLTLADIATYTDVFYIGGTKNGALLGEAIIFTNTALADNFDYILKQRGALMAKGRLLGIQFLCLFEDKLYFELAAHANKMATLIADTITNAGYEFLTPPESNQLFPILPMPLIQELQQHFEFFIWKPINQEYAAIRLITSWATSEDSVKELTQYIINYNSLKANQI